MSIETRIKPFGALFGLGGLGILALVLDGIQNPAQYKEIAAEAGISPELIVLLSAVQIGVFLAIAVAVGMYTAPKLGFTSRVRDRVVAGTPLIPELRKDITPGLAGGLATGGMLLIAEVVAQRFLPDTGMEMTIDLLVQSLPLRVFYGGITEELIARWGVMALLAFVLWRLLGGTRTEPSSRIIWTAILLSALVFGALHLPLALSVYGTLSAPVLAFILAGNGFGGVVFGWLFWRYSLEAAMIAHTTAHVSAVSVWLVLLVI